MIKSPNPVLLTSVVPTLEARKNLVNNLDKSSSGIPIPESETVIIKLEVFSDVRA